jgi:hypothetical protein
MEPEHQSESESGAVSEPGSEPGQAMEAESPGTEGDTAAKAAADPDGLEELEELEELKAEDDD